MANRRAQMTGHRGAWPGEAVEICAHPRCDAAPDLSAPVPLCDQHVRRVGIYWQTNPTPITYQAERPRAHGSVYFIRQGERVKIGWTRDLPERFSRLQGDALLHTEPGTREDERRAQAAFDHRRIEGEWFEASPDLLSFILRLKTGAA